MYVWGSFKYPNYFFTGTMMERIIGTGENYTAKQIYDLTNDFLFYCLDCNQRVYLQWIFKERKYDKRIDKSLVNSLCGEKTPYYEDLYEKECEYLNEGRWIASHPKKTDNIPLELKQKYESCVLRAPIKDSKSFKKYFAKYTNSEKEINIQTKEKYENSFMYHIRSGLYYEYGDFYNRYRNKISNFNFF